MLRCSRDHPACIEVIEPLPAGTHTSIAGITGKLSRLISRQQPHLLFEEIPSYPHVAQYLGNADRDRINEQFSRNEDPLFGDRVSKQDEPVLTARRI